MPRKKKTLPGMESRAHEDLTDAAGLGERTRPPDVAPAGEKIEPVTTSTRSVGGPMETAASSRCDYAPCACPEPDYERNGRRFCGEACADMQADAEADERTMDLDEVEPCLCGHPGCGVGARGTGVESGLGRNP